MGHSWVFKSIERTIARSTRFTGRASVREFWAWTAASFFAVCILAGLQVALVFDWSPPFFGESSYNLTLWALRFLQLVILFPTVALMVRRVHDQNRSGSRVLWFVLASTITCALVAACSTGILFLFFRGQSPGHSPLVLIFPIGVFLAFLVAECVVIHRFFSETGTRGPNRFGLPR